MSMNIKKVAQISGVVLLVLIIGFGGGMAMGRFMVIRGGGTAKAESAVKSYPLCYLGEFQVALPGAKYVEGHLISFEPVLELEDERVAETLNTQEYWRAVFRNEVLAEVMGHTMEAFRTPEGMLNLAAALAKRLNSVAPSFTSVDVPIRRVLFKSFIMQ